MVSDIEPYKEAHDSSTQSAEVITLPVTVVNNTGVDIYGLYASPIDTTNWEENILGGEILYTGEEIVVNFTFGVDIVRWDFAMEDEAGNSIEFYDLDFSECTTDGAQLVFEYDGENGYATLH